MDLSSEDAQGKLVQAYINLRDAIEEYEDKIKELKEKQNLIADKINEHCAANNMEGFKTPYGTVSRRVSSTYWTTDWGAMYEWIKERDAMHLLQKRLHDTNVREFVEENPEDIPPGLQAKKSYRITVTKPRSK